MNPRSGTTHQVQVGSGQGQRHSGALSDYCFYRLAERGLVQNCRAVDYHILLYLRYRDDILFVAESWDYINPFLQKLSDMAGRCWKLEIDACSAMYVPMLDVLVHKERRGAMSALAWRPYKKPSARHLPLHDSSQHLRSTHESWPLAELQRFSRTCMKDVHFRQRRLDFIRHLEHHFVSRSIIDSCRLWYPKVRSIFAKSLQSSGEVDRMWLVLPFHAACTVGVRRALAEVQKQFQALWSKLGCSEWCLGLACASGGLNLQMILRRALQNHD